MSMALIMGTKVEVSGAHVGILIAEADIQGLTVKNPKGMSGTFVGLKEGLFDMNIWSFIHEPIDVQKMILNEMDVNIIQPIDQKSNIQIILENLRKHMPQEKPANATFEEETTREISLFRDAMHKKIMVGELNLTNIHVSVYAPLEEEPVSFNVSDIMLRNVGTATNGIPAYQLLEVILENIITGALKSNVAQQLLMNSVTALEDLVASRDFPGSGVLRVVANATRAGEKAAASALRGAANATEKVAEGVAASVMSDAAKATETGESVAEDIAKGLASVVVDAAAAAEAEATGKGVAASVLRDAANATKTGERVAAGVLSATKTGERVGAGVLSDAANTTKSGEKAAASVLSDVANATKTGEKAASKKIEEGVAALMNPGSILGHQA